MFERFTRPARETVVHAQTVGREFRHAGIGSQHLLLSLLATPSVAQRVLVGAGADAATLAPLVRDSAGPAADAAALRELGIDVDEVRRRAEESFGPGALDGEPRRRRFLGGTGPGHLPFDSTGRETLTDALRVAISLRHNCIGTEHLLLAILDHPEGPAVRALRAAGVDLDRETATGLVLAEIRRSA